MSKSARKQSLSKLSRRSFLGGGLIGASMIPGLASATPFTQAPVVDKGTLTYLKDFPAKAVTQREIVVWQPADEFRKGPLPVIYMHDGEAGFDADASPYGTSWELDLIMNMLCYQGVGPAIIVGIAADGERRSREYNAPTIAQYLDGDIKELLELSCGGQLLTNDYFSFIVDELKPYIDSNFDTLPDRDNTYLMGASMGGLVSLEGCLSRSDVFGGCIGFSAHLFLFGPQAQQTDYPQDAAQRMEAAIREGMTNHLPDKGKMKAYFQRGTLDLDSFYGGSHRAVAEGFLRKGYDLDRDFKMVTDLGAAHYDTYWKLRVPEALTFVLA